MARAADRRAVIACMVIGAGMGGLAGGIVLRQILQWHHLISHLLPPLNLSAMQTNVFWDGVFQAALWVVTLIGVGLLWRAARRGVAMPSLQRFAGALLFGCGLFNIAQSLILQHFLGLHHVRQVPGHSFYNLAFLSFGGVILGLVGGLMLNARSAGRRD